ncbi:MAG: transporter substrate-binding domain-containing protein [Kiloniellaceae bacterium]
MPDDARSELSVPGQLRAGINLGNSLLVTGRGPKGEPQGVAPDVAAALAERLGVAVSLVTFASPGEVADAVARDAWDIALIAEEPERAETIDFCGAYVEIDATYLVPAGSPLQSIDEVDRPGLRIAVSQRAAYDLYLSRTLRHATLQRAKGHGGAVELLTTEKLDALAGLLPALQKTQAALPGSRILEGRYTAVRQAVGTRPGNAALKAFVQAFLAEARESGLISGLIDRHGVAGKLQVASAD